MGRREEEEDEIREAEESGGRNSRRIYPPRQPALSPRDLTLVWACSLCLDVGTEPVDPIYCYACGASHTFAQLPRWFVDDITARIESAYSSVASSASHSITSALSAPVPDSERYGMLRDLAKTLQEKV